MIFENQTGKNQQMCCKKKQYICFFVCVMTTYVFLQNEYNIQFFKNNTFFFVYSLQNAGIVGLFY